MYKKDLIAIYKDKINNIIQKIYKQFKSQPQNYDHNNTLNHFKILPVLLNKLILQFNSIYHLIDYQEGNEHIDEFQLHIKNTKIFRSSLSAEVFGIHNKRDLDKLYRRRQNMNNKYQKNLQSVYISCS
ncbi:unnamed protein product [Paramecium primaurelia]|uniref:Uncharacterized protein n=1 Tax=Paramecium primaurelia TaxID=5886 RepID=A0A8S1NU68_PARPR|nr:unnamed protein product [Paramecium primaurelia]